MVIDYKTDYSQPWNQRIGSLPQSILYSVMPRHKMVRDNQISLDNQPPPVYALKHENTHTSPLSLYLCFAAKYQTPGVEICGKRAPNRVNACSIEVPEPHPHVWEWEQDFDFATPATWCEASTTPATWSPNAPSSQPEVGPTDALRRRCWQST